MSLQDSRLGGDVEFRLLSIIARGGHQHRPYRSMMWGFGLSDAENRLQKVIEVVLSAAARVESKYPGNEEPAGDDGGHDGHNSLGTGEVPYD